MICSVIEVEDFDEMAMGIVKMLTEIKNTRLCKCEVHIYLVS